MAAECAAARSERRQVKDRHEEGGECRRRLAHVLNLRRAATLSSEAEDASGGKSRVRKTCEGTSPACE
eukprot:6209700-Pleurochrysis_carterae.AAC.4